MSVNPDERFPEYNGNLWTRVVSKEYAVKHNLPIDLSFKVLPTNGWEEDDWVVVNVPLGWTDGSQDEW